jgi:hypothetical protein
MADALIRRVISPQAHVVAISSFIFAIFVLVKDESANDCIRKRQMERRRLEWSRTTTERSNIVAIFYHHFEAGIKKYAGIQYVVRFVNACANHEEIVLGCTYSAYSDLFHRTIGNIYTM